MGKWQVSAELLIYSKHYRNKHMDFNYLNHLCDKLCAYGVQNWCIWCIELEYKRILESPA